MVIATKGPMKAAKSNKLAVLLAVSAGLVIAGAPLAVWATMLAYVLEGMVAFGWHFTAVEEVLQLSEKCGQMRWKQPLAFLLTVPLKLPHPAPLLVCMAAGLPLMNKTVGAAAFCCAGLMPSE